MYIISMTTILCRKDSLIKALSSLTKQTFHFDKLVINIDDYMSFDDYNFYFGLTKFDERIEINICDKKWRSYNKLLPTLQKYPNDVIITVDDDIFYDDFTIEKLVNAHIKNPDCIISHNSNSVFFTDDFKFSHIQGTSPKFPYKWYNSYMSNCCLFPPHVFDGTDLFDYDKMMTCTNGTHDELWFWVNSTINGVKSIVLTDFFHVMPHYLYDGGYSLCKINIETGGNFIETIKEIYSEKLNKVFENERPELIFNCDNVFCGLYYSGIFKWMYGSNFILNIKNLDSTYKILIDEFYGDAGCKIIE